MGAALHVGIVPLTDFTLTAFAGFVDALRLAADAGDRSRPVRCRWTVMSEGRVAVRASSGVVVAPAHDFVDPAGFDYLAVVGGTLHGGPRETPALVAYLARAAAAGVTLVGLCTGSLTLARAGLMEGRRACVSWFHHGDYAAEFPGHALVSDRLFLDEGDRVTCAGGVSVVHVAAHLIERHLGPGAADEALRILIEEGATDGVQPPPLPAPAGADPRVRRALIAMERRLAGSAPMAEVAREAGTTARHLARLFAREMGAAPAATLSEMRLARARAMVEAGGATLAEIAAACGFADGSHLARRFRARFGETPRGWARARVSA